MWHTKFFERGKSPPTAAKHDVLLTTFATWLAAPIEGPRLVFDGFAGAGGFADGSPGSPRLLLEAARGMVMRFVFAEQDAGNFAELARHVSAPHVELHCTSFEVAATKLDADAALFSFVDPYGVDGVSLETLVRLSARGPLVFYFASQALYTKAISTNGDSPRLARRIEALMGTPWHDLRRQVAALSPSEAKDALASAMVRALQAHARLVTSTTLRDGDAHVLICLPRDRACATPPP